MDENNIVESRFRPHRHTNYREASDSESAEIALLASEVGDEPSSYQEATRSTEWPKWKEAIQEELRSLIKNNTWSMVNRPEGRQVVSVKWVFKKKRDEQGKVARYKGRLVARGFTQVAGLDYTDTFAPVVHANTT